MRNDDLGKFGHLVIFAIIGAALYFAFDTAVTGDYRVTGSGPTAAGAALVNFIGDTTGPVGVAISYLIVAILLAAALAFRQKALNRRP